MSEDKEDNFTMYEDDIIKLLNKLSETIETFNTLSREQAENAILETNIKISSCKEILDKMEQHINDLGDEDETEKVELNKKLLNYKTEYHEILNKYKEIQDNYINKKAENALMDDPNVTNLVDDEDKNRSTIGAAGAGEPYKVDGELNNTIKKTNKENKNENDNKNKNKNELNLKSNNNKTASNNNNNEITLLSVTNNDNSILEHNNSNIMGYDLNANKEREEAFHQINKDYDSKKKKTILICVCVCIFVFLMIILIAILSSK